MASWCARQTWHISRPAQCQEPSRLSARASKWLKPRLSLPASPGTSWPASTSGTNKGSVPSPLTTSRGCSGKKLASDGAPHSTTAYPVWLTLLHTPQHALHCVLLTTLVDVYGRDGGVRA